MAKYQAGDRVKFGGKFATLETSPSGEGLHAREEATGRLMGKVHGDWALEPAPFAGRAVADQTQPAYVYKGPIRVTDVTIDGVRMSPDAFTSIPLAADQASSRTWPKFSEADLARFAPPPAVPGPYRIRDLLSASAGYDNGAASLEVMRREIQRTCTTYEVSAPSVKVLAGNVKVLAVYGSIDPGPSHRCPKCNGPASAPYVGFFEAEPSKCLRHGGCLAVIAPETKRGPAVPSGRESIWFARGGGLSVRHPLQDEAVAIWREVILDRAFSRTTRAALSHSIVV